MRARLLTKKISPSAIFPAGHVYALDPNSPIPDGWEEVEIVSEPKIVPCRGSELKCACRSDECECVHRRTHHINYRGKCLKLGCKCLRFREVE